MCFGFVFFGVVGDFLQCFFVEGQVYILKVEQCLVLFDDGVLWFGQDVDQGVFVEVLELYYEWQMVYEFGN